ncbi:MAG: hypothetical protein HY791_02895 [Deltaproteobacteria bacterium]|nr:hypothetical protein [Deltaproteobacteria bacterium]
MGIKLHETYIGGAKWSLNTLPATKGLEVLTWLMALVGAPLGEGIEAIEGATLAPDSMGRIVGSITRSLSDPKTVGMVKVLIGEALRDDKKYIFDDVFAENYGELTQLVAFAIGVNFRSFFDGNPVLAGVVGRAKKLGKSKPATSTGESGE